MAREDRWYHCMRCLLYTSILYQKDFYNFIYRSDVTIRDSVRPVIFTPKNKKIDDLLRELQPVSYTHLDVYKRQLQYQAER